MSIAFRAAAGTPTSTASADASVTIPAAVQSGDWMILLATRSLTDATATTPVGWTLLSGPVDRSTSLREYMFIRKAGATDASTSVTVTWSSAVASKRNMELAAYSGVDPTTPIPDFAAAAETVSQTTHVAQTVSVTRDGSWIVEFGSDRASPGSTNLSPPAGFTERDQQNSTGGGGTTTSVADTTAAVGLGTQGGGTWTGDVATANAILWTLVIQPAVVTNPILVGSALRVNAGETTAQAIVNRDTEYRHLNIHRIFFGGVPNWTSASVQTGRSIAVSFKMVPSDVLLGTYDATMRTWFQAAASRTGTVFWTYYHEPEDNWTTATTQTQFRQAFARLINISKEAGMPANLVSTAIYSDWTFDPGSGRNWLNWLPVGVDLVGVDMYDFGAPGLQSFTAHQTQRPSYSTVTAAGHRFAIPEMGYPAEDFGTPAAYANRITLFGQLADFAATKNDIDYITWFDGTGTLGNDLVLDSAGQAAWADVIDRLGGQTSVTLTPVLASFTPLALTLTPTVVLTPVTATFSPVALALVQPNVTLVPVTATFSVVPLQIPPPSVVTLVPVEAVFAPVPLNLTEGAVAPLTRKYAGPFRLETWPIGLAERLAVKIVVNQTLYRLDGVWKIGENLTYLDVENADRVYYGGYELNLDNDRLDELVAAGLGQYVINT